MELRTQGSRPRLRTQKIQGQGHSFRGQERSRPRFKDTGASVLTKKVFKIFFRQSPKKGLEKFFSGDLQNFNNSKNTAVLEPRTGQFLRN